MSKLSLDKFIELVDRSKLIAADRLAAVVADWKSQATLAQLDDAHDCAEHLVKIGVLTGWQCKKLIEGRHRGFFLGKYKLLDHLGSGGMSSVYLAEHVLMQRRAAIKVLPQNRVSDSSYLARFHLEGQAAAALDHQNIVRAYDLDNDGRIHYLVMEYIEGHDLHALVDERGPLDYHTAANYVAQAAKGLEHAHQCGLVHRDIKPANLLVDLKGTVKILDMGLAKFTVATQPEPGFAPEEQVLGTADYLAPEQAVNSQTVDERADIYALGCTLYYLLTGHPPFAEGTSLERMAAHRQRVAPSVLVDCPDAPEALVAICERMMEKSPDKRYQTAVDVEQALAAWLESEASFGRVNPAALAAMTPGRKAGGYQAGSKANLVSGSASDLSAESPQLLSPLQDTDPNLNRATIKMPSRYRGRSGDSSRALPQDSEVLPFASGSARDPDAASSPSGLTPPPVVAPPVALPPGPPEATWTARPLIPSAIVISGARAIDDELLLAPGAVVVPIVRRRRRARSTSWPWIVVLTALVLVALLLAIVAM
jgi:serine/threonine protein kinase